MSQIVANLKKQQSDLSSQRLQMKDVLDNIEKTLGELNNILGVIEALDKERQSIMEKASEAVPTEADTLD